MSVSGFEIAIGAAPTGTTAIESELALLKPALLYGDKVRLYSLSVNMLAATAAVAELDEADRIELLKELLPILDPTRAAELRGMLEKYEELRGRRRRSPDEIRVVGRLGAVIERAWREMQPGIGKLLSESGVEELERPISDGLLEVEPLLGDQGDIDEMLAIFVEKLDHLLTGDRAYPLFDDATGALVEARVREGLLTPGRAAKSRGKQVGLATGLLGRLPSFPGAAVADILEIRRELQKPLVRFRAAMVEFGRRVNSSPYEPDFQDELSDIYIERVAPALQEIEDQIAANDLLRHMAGDIIRDPKSWVGGAIAIGVSQWTDIPTLIAGGVATALPPVRARWQEQQEKREIEKHQLYLLHRTEKLLES